MNIIDFVRAVDAGEFDSKLELLFETLRQRQREVARSRGRQTLASIEVGALVRFRKVRPKYLEGATGTVASIRGNKVMVTLPEPIGKFGTTIACPPSLLELVEE